MCLCKVRTTEGGGRYISSLQKKRFTAKSSGKKITDKKNEQIGGLPFQASRKSFPERFFNYTSLSVKSRERGASEQRAIFRHN